MTDLDIAPARATRRSRTTSTKTRLLETAASAVDIAPARDGCGTAEPANPSSAAPRLNNDQQSKQAAYQLHLKERGLAPSSRSRKDLRTVVRKKPRVRFRGTPPPLTFDIDALPDSTLLDVVETAAAVRRSTAALENWRLDPNHPLRWRKVSGRILYEVGSLREFLKGEK
jgi:hypothetical protein